MLEFCNIESNANRKRWLKMAEAKQIQTKFKKTKQLSSSLRYSNSRVNTNIYNLNSMLN